MSAASCLLSEDQFRCSICLDVFTDPVTTPCGHNYCKTCITQHWNRYTQCVCPLCKEMFYTRPELKINTFISEMTSEFRQAVENNVECDFCNGTKMKAIKSCLKCEASYYQTHLEPHLTAARLRSHQMNNPVDNLEDRMCQKLNIPVELLCKTDQKCLCMLCTVFDHKNHEFISLKDEYKGKRAKLKKTVADIKQKMQERRLKIQELKQSAKLRRKAADRERVQGIQLFAALKQHLENIQADFMETLEEQQRKTEKQTEDFIKELEQELSEQKDRVAEAEKLLASEDYLHLLQSFSSINTAPQTKDWTHVGANQRSHEGSLEKAVAQLEEAISEELKKLLEMELKRIQQFAVDVTLDPDTAHPNLILSDDNKRVHHSDMKKTLPEKPQRFDRYVTVLGKQRFSSGRFYYEVQVKGKTGWCLGVIRETSNRKGYLKVKPQEGFWTVMSRNENEFSAGDVPLIPLSLKLKPEKVGVFVDYEEGLVSFYNVDAASLIFSFTGCSFTHKLLPYFNPCRNSSGTNSAPLVISAVNHTE